MLFMPDAEREVTEKNTWLVSSIWHLTYIKSDRFGGNIRQTKNRTASKVHQADLKYLNFMLFMVLIHIFVLLPDQFKTYELISVVLTVTGCCQEPPQALLLWKRKLKLACCCDMQVFNRDWAWCCAKDGCYSFPEKYFFFPVFLSGFWKPIFLHYFVHKGQVLEWKEVTSLVTISVGLFICWVGRRKSRKGWFHTKITRRKLAWNHPAPGCRFPRSTCCLVLCLVQSLQMEAGYFNTEPNIKNRTSWKHHH